MYINSVIDTETQKKKRKKIIRWYRTQKKEEKKAINNNDDNIMLYIQRKILISDKLERIFTILFFLMMFNTVHLQQHHIGFGIKTEDITLC